MKKKCDFAVPDTERFKRQSFSEAIYCPGKTDGQIIHITGELFKTGVPVIATRAQESTYRKLKKRFPGAVYHKAARLIVIGSAKRQGKTATPFRRKPENYICIVTAGTSDIPVAEESAVTAEVLGNKVERIFDIGIAGLHRIEKNRVKLQGASCIIVCAGMEGALPGIIGGLVSVPVIGVPTSVGYGTSFNGITPLFTMLNSCVANLCCVNIDDGYGAGILAHLINKKI